MSQLNSSSLGESVDRLFQLSDLCANLALSLKADLIPPQISEICEIGAEELQDVGRELSRHSINLT